MGVLGRSTRLFQAFYLALWYAGTNSIAVLDFMGAIRENGHPAGPVIILGVSVALFAIALLTNEARYTMR